MIYTEYFARGTQPTTVCPLHESPSSSIGWPASFGKDNQHPGRGRPTPACRRRRRRARPAAAPTSAASATRTATKRSRGARSRGAEEEARLLVEGVRRRRQEDRRGEEERRRAEEGRGAQEAGGAAEERAKRRRGRTSGSRMPLRDIVGHRHLLELLAGAAERGSLPPSLIFAGPDGVGKRGRRVALAQLLNCQTRRRPTARGDRP